MTRAELETAHGAAIQAAGGNDPQWNARYLQGLKDSGLWLSSAKPRLPGVYLEAPHALAGPDAWPVPMFVVKGKKP